MKITKADKIKLMKAASDDGKENKIAVVSLLEKKGWKIIPGKRF